MQRYILKLNIQIKFYFFIENLCFCSPKIAVCAPKITIESKNCRLKITIISKNYRLKILVRACMCARVYMRVYMRVCVIVRTPQERETRTTGKGRNTGHQRKNLFIYV